MEDITRAFQSLENRTFFKLVCGASFNDLQIVTNLAFLFSIAGVDAIDLSASPDVILAARKGVEGALERNSSSRALKISSPVIMASINLDYDPHFRKVEVDLAKCDLCSACIKVCPTEAFNVNNEQFIYLAERCYGCGDCPSICHVNALSLKNIEFSPRKTLQDLLRLGITSIEIHFGKNYQILNSIWDDIKDLVVQFNLLSFSIGGKDMTENELKLAAQLCFELAGQKIIIQCDGQSMSGGSIKGKNKDELAINVAKSVLDLHLPVYVQLSGGTDEATYLKAKNEAVEIHGVAIGSYARKKLLSYLTSSNLCEDPTRVGEALLIAQQIVQSVKRYSNGLVFS